MQISGRCTVTHDSATVIASSADDWSAVQTALGYGLPVFFSLIGSTEVPWPVASAIAPGSSVSGFWEIVLITPWAGDTASDARYMIHKDFTPEYFIPIPSPGDYQGAQLIARAYAIIDAALAANRVQRVKLDADLAPDSTGTLTNVTGLSFALVAGVHYKFAFELLYRSTNVSTGLKIGLTTPLSPDFFSATVRIHGRAAEGAGVAFEGVLTASGDAITSDAVLAENTTYPARVEGTIKPSDGNAGNLQLQFASEGTNAVTPKAGSNGRLWYA